MDADDQNGSDLAEKARLRVMAARIIAQGRWPYAASVIFNLKLVEAKIPTMAVDSGWRLYYSPAFAMSMEPEQLATILLHESLHCIMAHNERFQALGVTHANHLAWNLAGDCAINATLDGERMPFPAERGVRYIDFAASGMHVEASTESNYFALTSWADGRSHDALGDADCGSATGGSRRGYELDPEDTSSPAATRAQRDSTRDRVASEVLKASNERGSIPGDLLRWAQDHLDPQVDWRKVFGASLRAAVAGVSGRRDYSYLYPSRRTYAMRAMGHNFILPAMRQPPPPRIAVVVDTSGSLSDTELRQLLGEVLGIARSVGVSGGIDVIPCDAKPGPVHRLSSIARIADLELPGGGGTDMGAGIAAALDLQPGPQIVVILTDGYTPWPTEAPLKRADFIVGLTRPDLRDRVPPWMTAVLIEQA